MNIFLLLSKGNLTSSSRRIVNFDWSFGSSGISFLLILSSIIAGGILYSLVGELVASLESVGGVWGVPECEVASPAWCVVHFHWGRLLFGLLVGTPRTLRNLRLLLWLNLLFLLLVLILLVSISWSSILCGDCFLLLHLLLRLSLLFFFLSPS